MDQNLSLNHSHHTNLQGNVLLDEILSADKRISYNPSRFIFTVTSWLAMPHNIQTKHGAACGHPTTVTTKIVKETF